MSKEYEIQVLDINVVEMRKKLKSISGKKFIKILNNIIYIYNEMDKNF